MSHDRRAVLLHLGFVLLAWGAPLPAQAPAPARTPPLASAPPPSFLHTRPVDETVYRLGDGDLWPKDPTLGGFLGGAIGCATGAIVGRMVSSAEQRTRNTWAGCLWVGVVGVGAGSGWRVPGRFRQH